MWRLRWGKIWNLDFNTGGGRSGNTTTENLGELYWVSLNCFSLPSGFGSQAMMAFPRAWLSWYVIHR